MPRVKSCALHQISARPLGVNAAKTSLYALPQWAGSARCTTAAGSLLSRSSAKLQKSACGAVLSVKNSMLQSSFVQVSGAVNILPEGSAMRSVPRESGACPAFSAKIAALGGVQSTAFVRVIAASVSAFNFCRISARRLVHSASICRVLRVQTAWAWAVFSVNAGAFSMASAQRRMCA